MLLAARVPLLRLALPLAFGIALEDRTGLAPAFGAGLAVFGLGLWLWRRGARSRAVAETLIGVGLGALSLALRLHAPVPVIEAQPVALTALGAPQASARGCQLPVYLHGARPGRALLRGVGAPCRLLPGERALARIGLERPRPATNPGGSDPRARLARRALQRIARLEQGALAPVAPAPRGIEAGFERARRAIGERLDPIEETGSQSGALLRTLSTADTSRLDEPIRTVFARSGTTHLLSVSGTHVAFVVWLVARATAFALRRTNWLRALRGANAIGLALGVASGLCYAGLCGFGPPALRAAAMAFAAGVALLGGRPGAGWNALALAALCVLGADPAALFEPSFQLSFTAVAGLLLWRPPPGFLRGSLHVSLAAGLATAPLAAAIGAPLPAGWLLSNALAVPYFSAVVVPLALAAGLLGAWLGGLLALAHASADLGLWLLERLSSPDLLVGPRDPAALALLVAALGFAARCLALERRALALAFLAAAAFGAPGALRSENSAVAAPSLLFLDVGHGDAVLLRAARRAWLIDAGGSFADFDAGRAIVLPALRAEGVRALDALVLSHADLDHVGGAESVLRALPVRELWLTRATLEARGLARVRALAARRGVAIRVLAAGELHGSAELRLRALWPRADLAAPDSNAGSLVLRAETEAGCALLSGDAPAAVERALVAADATRCAVLKLGHHGSATSSDPRFLDALAPELAVASAGARARSPLPHASVAARLEARDVSLWQTRRDGAIRVVLGHPGPAVAPHLTRPFRD